MLRKLPFFLVAKLYRKKVVLHFHSYDPATTINSRFKRFYRFMFSKADRVIVLTQTWKDLMKKHLSLSNHITIIYNPCTTTGDQASVVKQNIILYAGSLIPRKGYADLIRAFHLIREQSAGWKLVFAGAGEIEEGKQLARESSISDRIEFAGWVSGEEKELLFASASIFCLPSYAEGFPMAILDAWSYGLPVIATPVGGIPDILKDKVNGLLFNPGDILTLTRQLLLLIEHPELRDALRRESSTLVTTIFNLQEIEKQICEIYQISL
jgi:glycosyltransferase involved in cell wall biosynthesis